MAKSKFLNGEVRSQGPAKLVIRVKRDSDGESRDEKDGPRKPLGRWTTMDDEKTADMDTLDLQPSADSFLRPKSCNR